MRRSFSFKLGLGVLFLLLSILGGAYVFTRTNFNRLSKEYAEEIVSLTQNNVFLIDTEYDSEYYVNKRRFNNVIGGSLHFSPQLSLAQVISDEGKILYDLRYAEVTGTQVASSGTIKQIKKSSGEEYVVNSLYCAGKDEIPNKENVIIQFVVQKLTAVQCDSGKVQAIELIFPDTGNKHISARYVFTYERIHTWLFTVLVTVVSLLVFILFGYFILYYKVAKPLATLRTGAIEMARGNLKHKVRVRGKNELATVANFMNEVARNLEEVMSDLEEKERMVSELDVASKIQQNLLPTETPELPGLEMVGRTRSSTEVGGDIFNYIEVDENQTLIYVGDVTGHGVPACLLMIMVDELLHVFSHLYSSVRDILVNVNNNLAPRIDTTMFVTMLLFGWDIQKQRLSYASAGHEHIIHYHAATNKCDAIKSGGIALGMVMDMNQLALEHEITLEDGDAIVIYTDGITEAKNSAGELFGLEQLKETVDKFGYRTAQGIFDGVTKTLSTYMGEEKQHDDITLVVMKHKATTPEEIERRVKKAKLSIKEKALKREQKAIWDWDKPAKV